MSNKSIISRKDNYLFAKEVIKSLRSIKYIQRSIYPKNQANLYNIYIKTLKRHNLLDSFESHLNNPLYKLVKFDKITSYKDEKYFVKLDQLLKYLKLHIEILDEHKKNTLNDSTINTTHTNHKRFINSEINDKKKLKSGFEKIYMGDNINEDQTYNSIIRTTKILNAYQSYPDYMSLFIEASKNDKFDYMTQEHKTELQKLSEKIFSYKLKLSIKDIVKSFQAYAIDIYHEKSVQNQLMKDCKPIEDKELVKLLGDVSKENLDETISKPNVKNLHCELEYIDYKKGIFLLRPTTTKKVKRMYIKSYEDLLLKLSKISMDS